MGDVDCEVDSGLVVSGVWSVDAGSVRSQKRMYTGFVYSSLLNSLLYKMMKIELESVSSVGESMHEGGSEQSVENRGPPTNNIIVSNLNPSIADELLRIELELCAQLSSLTFSMPVQYVYSPIDYAFDLHAQFVRNFCKTSKKVLFLGMNPGPWGMSQTGVRTSNSFPLLFAFRSLF